jgi:hypothetical protein
LPSSRLLDRHLLRASRADRQADAGKHGHDGAKLHWRRLRARLPSATDAMRARSVGLREGVEGIVDRDVALDAVMGRNLGLAVKSGAQVEGRRDRHICRYRLHVEGAEKPRVDSDVRHVALLDDLAETADELLGRVVGEAAENDDAASPRGIGDQLLERRRRHRQAGEDDELRGIAPGTLAFVAAPCTSSSKSILPPGPFGRSVAATRCMLSMPDLRTTLACSRNSSPRSFTWSTKACASAAMSAARFLTA